MYCVCPITETSPPNVYAGTEDQRLALHILKLQNFVPEHIEKRTLVNSVQPGVSQVNYQNVILPEYNNYVIIIGVPAHVGRHVS